MLYVTRQYDAQHTTHGAAPPPRSKTLNVKLTPEQYSVIEQRARKCGVTMSTWMRSICSRSPGDPHRSVADTST